MRTRPRTGSAISVEAASHATAERNAVFSWCSLVMNMTTTERLVSYPLRGFAMPT